MIFEIGRTQHWVVEHSQLLAAGLSASAIEHRRRTRRLHTIWPGIYAVGRADLTDRGRWLAAVLAAGPGALLSHQSAAALWGLIEPTNETIHVSVPGHRVRLDGIRPHRRSPMPPGTTAEAIPATTPLFTLLDLASVLDLRALERAVTQADRLRLVDPPQLEALVDEHRRRRGIKKLRLIVGSFARTDSDLERRFLRLAERAGLETPRTQASVCGFRVDFFWPDLRLVVETDGLTYHRSAVQQGRDRERDQVLTAAGLTCLRFTNAQVRREQRHVIETLSVVAKRLRRLTGHSAGP